MSTSNNLEVLPRYQAGVLIISLLNRCNLHCQHCYMTANAQGGTILPLEIVLRSLGETQRLGIGTVYLSGGEPFLYPELGRILAFAAMPHAFHLAISTNGTLIRDEHTQLLKDSKATVQISIDGDELYHDKFRGSTGAFRAAHDAIQGLVGASVPVACVVTVCKDNIDRMHWLAEWAADMGVEHISFQPLQELGRGYEIREKKLSSQETCDLFLQASDLGYAFRKRGLRVSLAYQARAYLLEHPCAAYVCNGERCHRKVAKEIKTLVIREDGTVLPEIPSLSPRYALGNVHNDTLCNLVQGYFANGYADFHRLCYRTYEDTVLNNASPIIPWDEILSERSWADPGVHES